MNKFNRYFNADKPPIVRGIGRHLEFKDKYIQRREDVYKYAQKISPDRISQISLEFNPALGEINQSLRESHTQFIWIKRHFIRGNKIQLKTKVTDAADQIPKITLITNEDLKLEILTEKMTTPQIFQVLLKYLKC